MTEHHSPDEQRPPAGALLARSHVHSHSHEGRLEASDPPEDDLDGLPHRAAVRLPPELDDAAVRSRRAAITPGDFARYEANMAEPAKRRSYAAKSPVWCTNRSPP